MTKTTPSSRRWLGLLSALLVADSAGAQTPGWPDWSTSNRWQLGVRVENTTTGAQIAEIEPGSPAEGAGLVPGDWILAVGGRQVGYIDGRLVDLGEAIASTASGAGQVTVLLNTRRTGVASRSISLRSAGNAIEGTAYFPGLTRLSPQAVMNVRLMDVTYSNWTGVAVSEWAVTGASYTPFPFRLTYYPQQIYAGHRYALEAAVVDQGRVVFRTSQGVAVTPGSGKIALTLAPIASQQPALAGGTAFPYEQINQWYQSYLGRYPTSQELASWQNHIERGQPAAEIQSYLLSSSEYYGRYQNNNDLYLRGIFRTLYGREPSQQEMAVMVQRFNQADGIRSRFVQSMLTAGAL